MEGSEVSDAIDQASGPIKQKSTINKTDIGESAENLTYRNDLLLAEEKLDEEQFIVMPNNTTDHEVEEGKDAEENRENERSSSESDEEITNDKKDNDGTKKSYPKIKIIYKANQNSKLVASSKQTILDKSINKITEFSDEHLLTAERKTKLRNTKDDLLALNFGKLLNKSNKDLEN